jgi:hypothetical protein
VQPPQAFVLTNTIPNPIGASILGGVSKKAPSSILRSKTPTSLMGAAKVMCRTPLLKTLAILSNQPTTLFCMTATLCENDGTLEMMVRLKETFMLLAIPCLVFEANYTKVSKVQPKSWHVAMPKLHDIPTQPTIDQANVILKVMVVHNEEEWLN